MAFFAYILRCGDRSYYVGHTDDLERRVASHQAGEVSGYTAMRRPVSLCWSQEFATRDEALAAEMRIKGWSRTKKEALMRGDWVAIQRHAWGTRHPLPKHLAKSAAGASIPQPEREFSVRHQQTTSVRAEVSKPPDGSPNTTS